MGTDALAEHRTQDLLGRAKEIEEFVVSEGQPSDLLYHLGRAMTLLTDLNHYGSSWVTPDLPDRLAVTVQARADEFRATATFEEARAVKILKGAERWAEALEKSFYETGRRHSEPFLYDKLEELTDGLKVGLSRAKAVRGRLPSSDSLQFAGHVNATKAWAWISPLAIPQPYEVEPLVWAENVLYFPRGSRVLAQVPVPLFFIDTRMTTVPLCLVGDETVEEARLAGSMTHREGLMGFPAYLENVKAAARDHS